jgi:PAS domain-containing protein
LTGSPLGYAGYIDPDTGFLICPTMSREVWDDCRMEHKDIVFQRFHGLWGWVLENRQSLITNRPQEDPRSSGTPEGHLPIRRFLSVPAMLGKNLVGQVALANSENDYNEEDLTAVRRLAGLYAVVLQHHWDRAALRQNGIHLEEAVRQRTAELTLASRSLERDRERNRILLDLYSLGEKMGDRELYQYALDQAVALTDSRIGFFHRVGEDQRTVILTTWNEEALRTCSAAYDAHYPIEQAGNWVDCVRPGGRTAWVKARAFPVVDPAGKVTRIVGVAEDVTESRLPGAATGEDAGLPA